MAIVAKIIDKDEQCARCLIHPVGFSNRKGVQRDAFVPRIDDNNVSLLRMQYTTREFCFSHGMKIGGENFRGLAIVSQNDIDSKYCAWCKQFPDKSEQLPKPIIVYSPIDENNEYRDTTIDVNDTDKGLPMHADLHYSPMKPTETKSLCRSFSNMLIKGMSVDLVEEQNTNNG